MDKDELNQLLNLLKKFFATYDLNKKNLVTRNPVAALLKRELSKRGRWKRLNRGLPPKTAPMNELKAKLLAGFNKKH